MPYFKAIFSQSSEPQPQPTPSPPVATTITTSFLPEDNMISMGFAKTPDDNYILLAGGVVRGESNGRNPVYAFDRSYTRSTLSSLSNSRKNPMGTYVGNYTLFCGGAYGSDNRSEMYCDAYDASLTKVSISQLKSYQSNGVCGRVGNYVIISGGYTNWNNTEYTNAYDTNLTKVSINDLNQQRAQMAGLTLGDYFAVFGGIDSDDNKRNSIEAYNKNLTRMTLPTTLSVVTTVSSGIKFNDKGIIWIDASMANIFDSSFTRTVYNHNPVSVNRQRQLMFEKNNKLYCMGNRTVLTMDVYDTSMTKTVEDNILGFALTGNVSIADQNLIIQIGTDRLWITSYRYYPDITSSTYEVKNELIVIR